MFDNIFKFFRKEEKSKDLAKERLKLVLIHDKANVSPQFLEMVKGEIIKVIKKNKTKNIIYIFPPYLMLVLEKHEGIILTFLREWN